MQRSELDPAHDSERAGMNENGLTFERWCYAAGVKGDPTSDHRSAWWQGEDPTEWRAAVVP